MEALQQFVHDTMEKKKFTVARADLHKPWGGYIVLQEDDAPSFVQTYFPLSDASKRMTPKFLLIAPHKRLSWQYHHRRSESWRVVQGNVGVVRSDTDAHPDHVETHHTGDIILIAKGERHRLVGLDNWALVVEIWVHSDPDHLSDEADIVRVQDDYERA
jgi:mannose-6-phosphate isomerase